jgi:heme exporter protein CcmD
VAGFWAMGGYGAYVWTAFAFTILVLAGLLWQSWRFARKQTAALAAWRAAAGPHAPGPRRPMVRRVEEHRLDERRIDGRRVEERHAAGGPEPSQP